MTDALSVHVLGQEDSPIVAGSLYGKVEPEKSSWYIREKKKQGTMRVEELVLTLHKASPSGPWRDLFKSHYV